MRGISPGAAQLIAGIGSIGSIHDLGTSLELPRRELAQLRLRSTKHLPPLACERRSCTR
jgi:hypothetical protein